MKKSWDSKTFKLYNTDPDAQVLIANGAAIELERGRISIQAYSHPVQFGKMELTERG